MKKLHKNIAELSMIAAIPLTATKKVPQGRVRGLLSNLSKVSTKQLCALPGIPKKEYEQIIERVAKWGEMTWAGKDVHAVTMCSFALGMIENSEFYYPPRLINTLTDIVDFYDRKGKAMGICMMSGGLAADKWQMVMEG